MPETEHFTKRFIQLAVLEVQGCGTSICSAEIDGIRVAGESVRIANGTDRRGSQDRNSSHEN